MLPLERHHNSLFKEVLQKCGFELFMENSVCFDHLHYFQQSKMLPLERHHNSLFKGVLQAYVWERFEFIEKIWAIAFITDYRRYR